MQPKYVEGSKNSRNRCQEFNGVRYYEKRGQGYFQNKPTSEYLHRAVWVYHNGEIPKGFEIHHKDHNKANNRIDNLEALTIEEHQTLHAETNAWVGSEENIKQLYSVRDKAAEWHRSDEGREWHREHGKQTWQNREMHKLICAMCEEEFESPWPNKTKFCHQNCKMNYSRWRLKGFDPELKPTKRK